LSGDPVVDSSIDRPADQTKRRNLHHSDAIESDGSVGDDNDDDAASETSSCSCSSNKTELAKKKGFLIFGNSQTAIAFHFSL
jgi:hypothetical protein